MTKKLLLILFIALPCYAGNFNDNGATVGNDDYIGSSRITEQGEYQILLRNASGHTSKRGEVLVCSFDTDLAVTTCAVNSKLPFGIFGSTGIPNGGLAWVTIGGKGQFLLDDSTGSIRGYWINTSHTSTGKAQTWMSEPSQPTFSTTEHDEECGHCLETVTAGVDKLFWGIVHFR